MLTIDPVRWSPFFKDTCSACSAIALQINPTNTNDQTRFSTLDLISCDWEQKTGFRGPPFLLLFSSNDLESRASRIFLVSRVGGTYMSGARAVQKIQSG
jgi:hypothetical protein